MKHIPAPALERGIRVLRLLSSEREHSLQALASTTGQPKSSLLRVLETLIGCGLAARLPNGHYRPLACLAPVSDSGLQFRIQPVLDDLAASTGQTSEWYVPAPEGLILASRAESPDVQVGVRARVGFIRYWTGELDAVCVVGRAFNALPLRPGRFWRHVRDGKAGKVSAAEADRLIRRAAQSGFAFDKNLNANGVRRAACPILRNGRLLGVLAVAEYRRPGPDRMGEIISLLRLAASKLNESIIES